MFEKAPRVTKYCVECTAYMEMILITSFTQRFPSLKYCTQCSRAYDMKTDQPLGFLETGRAYFDAMFADTDIEQRSEKRCRLVGSREQLTPQPKAN